MPDDLKTAKFALSKIHQDMEAINRLAKSYLGVVEQMERTMEPIRRHQLAISRTFELSGAAARMKDIFGANQHLQGIFNQVTATSGIAESFSTAHQSWLDRLKPLHHDFSQLQQVSSKLALCDISLQLTATMKFMAGIDFEALRSHFQIKMPVISGLESSIAHVTASYGTLIESLRGISDVTRLPAFVLPGATREIYTTGFALETLRPWDERNDEDAEIENLFIADVERETSGCIALLRQVDLGLARPYIGAHDALNGNNPDRARHILSSLRELWNHLLRRLAPDNLVSTWILGNSNKQALLHEGRPTRRARVLYVCRELNNDPLTEFLMHDSQALVKLIDLFNRVHELETQLTDEQLRAILLKTDSWLMYILQIWAGTSRE